ncbi:hypothetical protein [Rhizobium paknamense]|uniref:Preprotein translocase subunit SecY n=1 Tax=Rhizobium paknamense TaxID=1206817 RepID=A0ABU0IAK2_9HYPH|nr:hypothetical protein [Rhizobium paknamense]MDQ0454311.1 hypothetical protein [Rhizobium paknamense]
MALASNLSSRTGYGRGKGLAGLVMAALILLIGYRISLPGLDGSLLSGLSDDSSAALARVSVLALGPMPIINALGHFEILILILCSFAAGRRWVSASRLFAVLPVILALLVAGFQAYGVARALEHFGSTFGDLFVPVTILCLVGATALLMAFIHSQARRQIDGLWLLLAASFLLSLPHQMTGYLELLVSGAFTLQTFGVALAPVVLAVALTAFTVRALTAGISAEGVRTRLHLLIWPLLLTQLVLSYVWPFLIAAPPEMARILLPDSRFGASLMLAGANVPLVALFTLAYARDLAHRREESGGSKPSSAVLLLVIVLQILVLSGLKTLLPLANLPVDLDWLGLFITTAVLMCVSGLATAGKQ